MQADQHVHLNSAIYPAFMQLRIVPLGKKKTHIMSLSMEPVPKLLKLFPQNK